MNIKDGKIFGIHEHLINKLLARGLTEFTLAQQAALKGGLITGENLFISAPTSGGKTTIAEIAAVQTALKGGKTVYLLSHKALAEEKFRLFSQLYANEDDKWFDVSISTGDRNEGSWENGILVATYEKFLSMTTYRENYVFDGVLVIADEIQLLNDESRGSDVETLCTRIKLAKPVQVISLSATVNNSANLAKWLDSKEIKVVERDVVLSQQIWYQGNCSECNYGETDFVALNESVPLSTIDACHYLLSNKFHPILVFTMTRQRAVDLAEELSSRLQKDPAGFYFSEQLDFFSEPLTLSKRLGGVSEKRVAFHTADLSLGERELIEKGLLKNAFDVVFATPTLAAGVNFPFQTVLFDSFERPWVPNNRWLPKDEYQNMSGRAGRLGMHKKGFSVLLPKTRAELIQANQLINPELVDVKSKLIDKGIRKLILNILSSKSAKNRQQLGFFFENTYWYYEQKEVNEKKLMQLPNKIDDAISWLINNEFVIVDKESFCVSDLGLATSRSGLLPSTVKEVVDVISTNRNFFAEDVTRWIVGLIHIVCASPDFAEGGQRYLPFSQYNKPAIIAASFLRNAKLFLHINASAFPDRVQNATYAMVRWIEGVPERQLSHEVPPISYGYMQRLSDDVVWVLSGIRTVLSIPSLNVPEKFLSELTLTIERVQYGVPIELIDIMKIAKSAAVPGFGRHRAMILLQHGLQDPNLLHEANVLKLNQILENGERVKALLNAVANYLDKPLRRWKNEHTKRAVSVGLQENLINQAYELLGDEYEVPIEGLLRLVTEWNISKLDKSKRQGVPDFQIECSGKVTVVECKTKLNEGAFVSKDDAFAILIKGADIKCDSYLTIGKPDFDTFSKEKSGGTKNVSLVNHVVFIEAIIKYLEGRIDGFSLYSWLTSPGYKQLDNLELFINSYSSMS
ncbi:MAG: DEAD/DEAH box helicase [Pseudomonadota bacterium]